MSKKALLLIMDGWGHGQVPAADAIRAAHTPFVDSLYDRYPHTELVTCGPAVGLPEGQMGNSEVGHLNLGAGRIVYQELQRINVAVENGELEASPVLQAAFTAAKAGGGTLHLLGLVSDGGVHSHTSHLKALCTLAQAAGVPRVAVHAFTDGRDTDPKSGLHYLADLETHLDQTGAFLATITGRYWAMDRDKRWERVKVAYDALVRGLGEHTTDAQAAIQASYDAGVTDEFIKPIILTEANGAPRAIIQEKDVAVCFNFRTDRCREITEMLSQRAFPEQGTAPVPGLHYVTMTQYDASFQNVGVIFGGDDLHNTLGEVLAAAGRTQLRIAETEKYPHVTFFFSGGRETPFEGERRILAPSPKDVPTYDLKPAMSAEDITAAVLPQIASGADAPDFICLNFANTDMVGHTGVWSAVVEAAETVDRCVARIVPAALAAGYAVFLTADHGNADYMVNDDGTPNTAHTLNPVPLFFISEEEKGSLKPGKLGDIAPSILACMGIKIPAEMTGEVLLKHLREEAVA